MESPFTLGIDVLLQNHLGWLRHARVGLVAHPASVNGAGALSPDLLWQHPEVNLTCLFGPEHGFLGAGGAGEVVADQQHPQWGIPVHSLYGATRKPTPAMLEGVDVIVFDLQDLAARCYTYVSTLRYVLEAAAESGKAVVVTDRPVPLPRVVDGPMLEPALESFVGCVPLPLAYGMTPGETARWLQADRGLDIELRVAEMGGYRRGSSLRDAGWPWVPPSPAIRSWESACAYTATVCCEALPSLDCDRRGSLSFRVLAAPWIKEEELCEAVGARALPGVRILPFRRVPLRGVRIEVEDPDAFKPVQTGVTLLAAVRDLCGEDRLWGHPGTRERFFDQLMGTDKVRLELKARSPLADLFRAWNDEAQSFCAARQSVLLYP